MSTYSNEIFNYITKRDNFSSAYDIYQLFPEVKNKLIEQFWLVVKQSLEELIKETDWDIEISDNIFETYSSLNIWFDDYFGVRIEKLHGKPYYGLRIEDENKNLNRQKIDKYVLNIEAINWMKKHYWWLGFTEYGIDFNNYETLKRILPSNREDFAQELANHLFNLANELELDVKKMQKMIVN